MAKRSRSSLVAVSFHLLVKTTLQGKGERAEKVDVPIDDAEFKRIVDRISDKTVLDTTDDAVIADIKLGRYLPFFDYEELGAGVHFGCFEGAY